jgi:hypothetical protein
MKERPILFSAPMVRAILDGSNTQTRLVVKPKISETMEWFGGKSDADDDRELDELLGQRNEEKGLRVWCSDYPEEGSEVIRCPYGQPGDRLWVRQEHYRFGHWEAVPGVRTKGGRQKWKFVEDIDQTLYDAPELYRKGRHHKDPATPAWHKRLARFMPRALSVINLEVVGIRVERLQDISEADALAEGVRQYSMLERIQAGQDRWARHAYRDLWESINGPGSWEANPWVWAIEFKQIKQVRTEK